MYQRLDIKKYISKQIHLGYIWSFVWHNLILEITTRVWPRKCRISSTLIIAKIQSVFKPLRAGKCKFIHCLVLSISHDLNSRCEKSLSTFPNNFYMFHCEKMLSKGTDSMRRDRWFILYLLRESVGRIGWGQWETRDRQPNGGHIPLWTTRKC